MSCSEVLKGCESCEKARKVWEDKSRVAESRVKALSSLHTRSFNFGSGSQCLSPAFETRLVLQPLVTGLVQLAPHFARILSTLSATPSLLPSARSPAESPTEDIDVQRSRNIHPSLTTTLEYSGPLRLLCRPLARLCLPFKWPYTNRRSFRSHKSSLTPSALRRKGPAVHKSDGGLAILPELREGLQLIKRLSCRMATSSHH